MLPLEYQIVAALALDLVLGDPPWLPHPVRLIGRLAAALETPLRTAIPHPRAAGIATAAVVIGATAAATGAVVYGAGTLNPALGTAVSILLLYATFAARDLCDHAGRVFRAVQAGDEAGARLHVSMMVGRDTENMDEAQVIRAAVESVGENIVDGISAPLFFAVLGGPIAAMAYKAVSTLDSTFGYKTERYIDFGWASAKIDDVANFLPARLTAPLIAAAALVLGMRPLNSIKICLRDRTKHASPNSAIGESAVAGALGVQLGGMVHRKGIPVDMPALGDPIEPLSARHIRRSMALALATTVLSAVLFLGIRRLAAAFLALIGHRV